MPSRPENRQGARHLDEAAELLITYARGVDDKRWDLVRDCFHDDAVDRHAEHTAEVDEFMRWVVRRHAQVIEARHVITNVSVEAREDQTLASRAYCQLYQGMTRECAETLEAYGLAPYEWLPKAPTGVRPAGVAVEMTGLCQYDDVLQHRDGTGLRIAERRVHFTWLQAHRV